MYQYGFNDSTCIKHFKKYRKTQPFSCYTLLLYIENTRKIVQDVNGITILFYYNFCLYCFLGYYHKEKVKMVGRVPVFLSLTIFIVFVAFF